MKKIIFLVLIIVFAVTFFTKSNFRNVNNLDSALLTEPVQTEIENKEIIKFSQEGYDYEITPLFNYDINGLVVHKQVYDTWYSRHKKDKVFVTDLCMIWGSNLKNESYKHSSLSFTQDFRFCLARWSGNLEFDPAELSNSHLVINNSDLEKVAKSIEKGDQVRVKGKLVNVHAVNSEDKNEYFQMDSSVKRTDASGGACEIIYVEEIEIIKRGNAISRLLNQISFWGIIVVILWAIIQFLLETLRPKKKPDLPAPPSKKLELKKRLRLNR